MSNQWYTKYSTPRSGRKKKGLSFSEHVTYPYLSLIESHNKSVWKNQIVKIHGTLNEVLQTYNIIIGIKLLHNPFG